MILTIFIFLISFKLIFSMRAINPKRKVRNCSYKLLSKSAWCLLKYWFGLQQSETVWINACRQKKKLSREKSPKNHQIYIFLTSILGPKGRKYKIASWLFPYKGYSIALLRWFTTTSLPWVHPPYWETLWHFSLLIEVKIATFQMWLTRKIP